MMSISDRFTLFASALGASGVGLGAIGAHALAKTLQKKGMEAVWKTASVYHLFGAVSVLGIASMVKTEEYQGRNVSLSWATAAGNLVALGTTMFSGSIYLLCLDIGPKKLLGPTTPVGGLLIISGYLALGYSVLASK